MGTNYEGFVGGELILGQSAVLHRLEDESCMAESIVRLASDREFRDGMRQRGLENVDSRFQTARMVDDYLAIYRELVPQG